MLFVWYLCLVFVLTQNLYKSLSEVKSEVEMVIKTGRQIVQKKQTENPKELDERVTALKLHYNELGAKVSVSLDQIPIL